jgi:hypothetical protein
MAERMVSAGSKQVLCLYERRLRQAKTEAEKKDGTITTAYLLTNIILKCLFAYLNIGKKNSNEESIFCQI